MTQKHSRLWRKIYNSWLLVTIAMLIASCHTPPMHDELPESWMPKAMDTHTDCSVIAGTYQF